MALIRGDNLSLSFGNQVLLKDTSFAIQSGQKICLVGRNGAGKSTLLKLILKEAQPDGGVIVQSNDHTIGFLSQALPEKTDETVADYVESGLAEIKQCMEDYQRIIVEDCHSPRLDKLEMMITNQDGWNIENRVAKTLSQLGLAPDLIMSQLSGGWRRRAALAKAMVQNPDLLILDEPTNHLDIDSIQWLEEQLINFKGALLFVSHDRAFVNKVSDTIMELDRGILRFYPGNYQEYRHLKEQQLKDEEKTNSEFDKRLANEEVWIRQGIKARRTRNEGRVRSLEKMRNQRSERLNQMGTSKLQASVSNLGSKLVAKAINLQMGFDKPLNQPFSSIIQKGDKLGILGHNGCGKTTFIKTLLGEIPPFSGEIEVSENLQVAYLDQLREAVDLNKTVSENIGDGREFVTVDGRETHVISYMRDFNFSADNVRAPASSLSGGEINRLLLAKLFTRPANLFILDEPTNDLDVETLEILEQMLVEIKATVIIISHDREFLDNCCSSMLVFNSQTDRSNDSSDEQIPEIVDIVGGYQDWLHYSIESQKTNQSQKVSINKKQEKVTKNKTTQKTAKLTYKENLLLDELPKKIQLAEEKIAEIEKAMSNADFYQDKQESEKTISQFEYLQKELEKDYKIWSELEEKRDGLK